ncbi:activating transcription factor 7-interacting protein 1-like isoform X1 [Carcharodon carcharias]|uniref:activating transcription factor 7-interacting protein 1-like isoform X1 n=1 Tax=Carcharodon carcharias TaxID=13397 RepID=UPI001B7DCEBE|nr:activating transcription factor 7-interacting protein 1-like isoform X1 [Carcharodon carcharias]XP_041033858.1 activating transcription factor 7-interacting protein 1-like isoform X1 [Carcharodon carcharias]XP_041033859.1 activating transcription factor 7-interacting protein 1-like isoform X1 [Carcharodon carcharias]XP_041033860.1 activating transcription factor 7-interacting protein 1-like isoform X1 [Carcharodon carcharias]XP_041033861.1 activating transcription factor 7-interacting protei
MDTSEELPKKVFKARKTMRASDRQQLEAIYKSREELLKANEETKTKLCNGRHENGDCDNKASLNTNCMDDADIDSINDVRLGPEELQGNSIDELSITQTPELNFAEKCLNENKDLSSKDEKMDSTSPAAKDEQISTGSTGNQILVDVESKRDDTVESDCVELKQDSLIADKSCSDSQSLSEKERPPSVDDSRSQEIPDESSLKFQSSSSSVREKEDHESSLDISEEAITSSIESVQEKNDCESSKMECAETESEIATKDKLSENKSAENNQLEIEEIIPILEKLAPEKDSELACNQGIVPVVDSPAPKDSPSKDLQEEQMDASPCSSPTKEECNGNLPEEAFLVLSDEDEPIIESKTESEELVPKNDDPDTDHKEQAADTRQKQEPNEVVPRKRSKSEDAESSISKRCRFSEDEYEAALKVKITARGEIRQTLEKIVQQIIEERISSMQSGVFDKKLAELKNRVEKIECSTRHESLISGLQAKLMQIEKRLGSANQARNDSALKKAQEKPAVSSPQQPPGHQTTQPVSPSKSYNPSLGASGSVQCRSGTVRQMLDLRRNMADTVASAQHSANSSNAGITNFTPPQVVGGQTKPQNAGTSGAVVTPVLPATAAVVGNNQSLSTSGSNQPMPVSLQSVPVLLTVPVAMSSQPQLLQPSANTLMTNQQSGIEFLPVQSQPTLNNLSKPLASQISANVAKANGASPSLPSPGVQRKSPGSMGPMQISSVTSSQTATVASVTSTQSILSPQISRTVQPSLGSPGHFSPSNARVPVQQRPSQTCSQGQVSGSSSQPLTVSSDSTNAGTSRAESSFSQATQRHPTAVPAESPAAKKAPPSGIQSAKTGGSDMGAVIDLTGDDEDDVSAQDARKQNQAVNQGTTQLPVSSPTVQPQVRTPAAPQGISPQQTSAQSHLPAPQNSPGTVGLTIQTTNVHSVSAGRVLTGQTSANMLQHQRPPMPPPTSQAPVRPPLPTLQRGSTNPTVFTTPPPYQSHNPVRAVTTQSQAMRQPSPQPPVSAGMSVRLPQTSYIVNNVISIPVMPNMPQFTVHHRPSQEPPRPIHPAPLPEAQAPQRLPPEAANTSPPQKPHLKLARVQSQNGIVLSWSVLEVDRSCALVDSYHLYAYHEDPATTTPSQWKKIGEVKALPLPMACTLTQFVSGSKYYFAVRAKDIYGRYGAFCDPQSTDVMSTQGN